LSAEKLRERIRRAEKFWKERAKKIVGWASAPKPTYLYAYANIYPFNLVV